MSTETLVFGAAIQPPPESCYNRGKWPKREAEREPESDSDSESESESESEVESKVKVELDPLWWERIPLEDLKESDFASRYEDDPFPYFFTCPKFVYENKAMRDKEEARKNAVEKYWKEAENISVCCFPLLIFVLILYLTLLICFCFCTLLHSPSMPSLFHAQQIHVAITIPDPFP
jgi:hypothetical protein